MRLDSSGVQAADLGEVEELMSDVPDLELGDKGRPLVGSAHDDVDLALRAVPILHLELLAERHARARETLADQRLAKRGCQLLRLMQATGHRAYWHPFQGLADVEDGCPDRSCSLTELHACIQPQTSQPAACV